MSVRGTMLVGFAATRPDVTVAARPHAVRARPGARRAGAAALLAVLAVLAVAGSAIAVDPFRLSGTVTDQAGVLSASEEQSIKAASDDLAAKTGLLLSVVFVDTTGGTGIDDWTDRMLQLNGFGKQDALLVVATEDRAYRLHAGPLSDAQAQEVAASIRPDLGAGDWAAAATGAAAGLETQLAGSTPVPTAPGAATPTPTATPVPGGTPPPADEGGFPWVGLILVIIGGLIVALIAIRFALDRRLRARSQEELDVQTGELARRANVLLLQTDDLVRDADQEVGFAEAQFGDDAAPYREAVAAAREDLKSAFAARQQLDDDVPEDAATRRQLLQGIVTACETAQKRLADQAAAFEAMRKLEENAPAILAGLADRIAALEARLPAAMTAREGLGAYAQADWASVAGNIPEAEKRIAFARAAVGTPPTATGAGRTARRAQTAVAEAEKLLDAIDRLAVSLERSRAQAETEIAAAEHDLAEADGAARAGRIPPAILDRIAEAQGLVAAARQALAAPQPDVLDALKMGQQANLIGDEVLAGIRSARDQAAREAAALDTAVKSAQIAVTRASDYIAARRNGVRHEARTRLAEAERHLDAAVRIGAGDPKTGTQEAVQAQRLADEAYRLAASDFDTWDSGGFGGPVRRGQEGEIIGAVLGGLIGGMLGAGRGGFGGTPWGSSGPPGGLGGLGGLGGGRGGGSWGGMLGGGRGGGRF